MENSVVNNKIIGKNTKNKYQEKTEASLKKEFLVLTDHQNHLKSFEAIRLNTIQ